MPLKVSDGIGAWIDDFKKSDAPQFKGKSDKERRDQAIAAYLSAKRGDKQENVKSADRKPEVYTKPDGKRGVRMVPVDREMIKKESVDELSMYTSKKLPNLSYPKKKTRYQQEKGRINMMKKNKQKGESVKEEMSFAVSIEGLPQMFISADSPGMLKQTLRKIVKQPSMIQSVKRVTDAQVKKTFRLKAQGREEGEE